ncbi:MAG: methionine aminotransferase [Bacteroidota bacterium]
MTAKSFSSKLPEVGTTVFTVMSGLAAETAAINLSQGFPDFDCDPKLTEAVAMAMRDAKNQYAPMAGLMSLRKQIAVRVEQLYGAKYDPVSEITIFSGATEALLSAIFALLHPGEEAIVLEPAYDSYLPAIKLAGGVAVRIPLRFPDYSIDWEEVKGKITNKTRLILVNSPHNPTGSVLAASDLEELQKIALEHGIIVIGDEVYEHMIYDGLQHESICRYPDLAAQSMVISSFGKSLHVTGWKVGYCLAPEALSKEFRKVHQFATFSTSTPFQHGIAHYLEHEFDKVIGLSDFYQKKRDLFLQLMEGSKFEPLPCKGTYFQLMKYKEVSALPDYEFSKWLTREKGVACIPVSVFYEDKVDNRVVRFCFAKTEAVLAAACERLQEL